MIQKQRLLAGLIAFLLCSSIEPCAAQVERYELGKRLRRFEQAWQTATPENRLKSTPAMQQAVSSFFGLQLKGAAAKLDQAWIAVRDRETSDWEHAGLAYRIQIDRAIFDRAIFDRAIFDRAIADRASADATTEAPAEAVDTARASEITFKLELFYPTKKDLPVDTQVQWECLDSTSGKPVFQQETDLPTAQQGISVSTMEFPPGDYRLRCRLKREQAEMFLLETGFSVLVELESQLEDMEQARKDKSLEMNASVRATLAEYQTLIEQGRQPFSAETDYPFFQILQLAKRIIQTPPESAPAIADQAKSKDLWLVLTAGRKRVPVRLRAPQTHSGKLPVLFLFHGAGGSENMFFETYGAGQAVQMGLDRGWLVVAPRQGLMGLALNCDEMLNALEPFFEVDRSQIFLLGHSMGAAQVIQQVSQNPQLPRAAAAIGGGRPVRDAKAISILPWFVSAGELDFGRAGAKAFQQSLLKAGATKANYLEIPGVEHLVIVQAVLPQAFEFFEQTLSTGLEESIPHSELPKAPKFKAPKLNFFNRAPATFPPTAPVSKLMISDVISIRFFQ